MFDLEQSINDWRRHMLAAGVKTPVPLEELECHLREEIERLMESGLGEPAAFTNAVKNLGPAQVLRDEFAKAGAMNMMKRRKLAGFFYAAVLGIYTLATICAMFKYRLSVGEWLSALAAQVTLLSGCYLIWRNSARIFPIIGSRRLQSAVGLLGGISGAVWFIVFANWILPCFSFTTGQLMVALSWAMVPTLILPTTAFLMLDNSENRAAHAVET
jgi:hypothetical protein